MSLIFLLLIVYQVKHFLCDFPLQTPYMLGKFLPGWKWIKPLAAHAGVHGLFTSVIVAFTFLLTKQLPKHPIYTIFGLALFDFSIHFIMDRIKASPNMLGRWKALTAEQYKHYYNVCKQSENMWDIINDLSIEAKKRLRSNTLFWIALGLDQKIHHLTHYVIIYYLASILK